MSAFGERIRNFCVQGEERGHWQGRLDFLAASIGYTTSLGVLWRFPFIVYKDGGEVFFGPFFFFMVVMALPLVFYEISLGQFTSSGTMTCWKLAPVFQGVGAAMTFFSAIVSTMSSMLLTLSLFYFFASFTRELPWEKCGNEWNSKDCLELLNADACTDRGWNASLDGGCYDGDNDIRAIWNETSSAFYQNSYKLNGAPDEYLSRYVLRSHESTGLDDVGPVVWHLALYCLLTWVLIAVILSRGVKTYGKVSYLTTICPWVVILIFFGFGLTLDGHKEGYKFFIYPRRDAIHDYRTWKRAALQVFYSMSCSFGGLITLGSYNKFANDTYRDSVLIVIAHITTSLFSGFTVFFIFGALAKNKDVAIEEVVSAGMQLAFNVMPAFFVTTSAPQFWSILWFLCITCLAIGPQLGYVETVITAILDVCPRLRRFRLFVVLAVCTTLFLLSLPFTTKGGIHLLNWLDVTALGEWSLFLIPIMELLALLVYGIPRFLNDVEVMTGDRFLCYFPAILGKLWMGLYLYLPTLAAVLFVNIVIRIDPSPTEYPKWADRLALAIVWSLPVCFIYGALLAVVMSVIRNLRNVNKYCICGALLAVVMSVIRNLRNVNKDWCDFVTPARDWGPAKIENRRLVQKYVPWFVVDPWTSGQTARDAEEMRTVEPLTRFN